MNTDTDTNGSTATAAPVKKRRGPAKGWKKNTPAVVETEDVAPRFPSGSTQVAPRFTPNPAYAWVQFASATMEQVPSGEALEKAFLSPRTADDHKKKAAWAAARADAMLAEFKKRNL